MVRATSVVLLIVALASGCTGTASTTPSTTQAPSLTGTWSGDVLIEGVTARMVWTLTQSNTDVTGPVLMALPTGTVLLNGFLTGTMAGSTLSYTISVGPGAIPSQPACVGQLGGTMNATLAATSTLVGNYAVRSSTCTTPFPGGDLTLTKQ